MTAKSISKICSVDGCGSSHKVVNGMCCKHYTRLRKHGDISITLRRRLKGNNLTERFWSGVNKTPGQGPNGDCWEWNNLRTSRGYGKINDGRIQIKAHILSWKLANGRPPQGMILHSCDNPPCVNPTHLREGTHQENVQDKVVRNRQARGEAIGLAKVTANDVRVIREKYQSGIRQHVIGKEFGLTQSSIGSICRYETWRHIT